jgi:hypothetical protein
MFAIDPPSLNLGKKEKISSSVGFASSILIFLMLGFYSISQMLYLIDGDPAILFVKTYDNNSGQETALDLDDTEFMLAFTVH